MRVVRVLWLLLIPPTAFIAGVRVATDNGARIMHDPILTFVRSGNPRSRR